MILEIFTGFRRRCCWCQCCKENSSTITGIQDGQLIFAETYVRTGRNSPGKPSGVGTILDRATFLGPMWLATMVVLLLVV